MRLNQLILFIFTQEMRFCLSLVVARERNLIWNSFEACERERT